MKKDNTGRLVSIYPHEAELLNDITLHGIAAPANKPYYEPATEDEIKAYLGKDKEEITEVKQGRPKTK